MGSLSTKQKVPLSVITSYSPLFVGFQNLSSGQLSNTVLQMHFCECAPLKMSLHWWESKMGMTPLAKKKELLEIAPSIIITPFGQR